MNHEEIILKTIDYVKEKHNFMELFLNRFMKEWEGK